MDTVNYVCKILGYILGVLVFYKTIYLIIGFFCKAKTYKQTDIKKKYAIVIPARNEEKTIGNLIRSINNQTYDQSLLKIFVIADNCTDNTASICRELGCIVYERNEPDKARKGYALNYFFNKIQNEYGIESYDAYMIFDADNLLKEDFIERMNEAFVENKNCVMGYRNSKNFDTNIISSAYGIHFCRSCMEMHRPRNILNLCTSLTGTGICISSHLLKDGWTYTTLTEDTELTLALNVKNITIGYCEAAEFYDEQPTNFIVGFNQTIKCSKLRLVDFAMYCKALIKNTFRNKDFAHGFSSYDMFWYIFPYSLLNLLISITYPLVSLIVSIFITKDFNALTILTGLGVYFGGQYLANLFSGTLTVIRERKHIHCSLPKTILYLICWPWFNMLGMIILLVALFKREVKWTPIVHKDTRTVTDINKINLVDKK